MMVEPASCVTKAENGTEMGADNGADNATGVNQGAAQEFKQCFEAGLLRPL